MTARIPADDVPTAEEMDLLHALRVVRRYLTGGSMRSAIVTSDAASVSHTGHSKRALDEACRVGAIRAVKVSKGWRIERADLAAWEAERTDRRRERPRSAPAPVTPDPADALAASVQADLDAISAPRNGRRNGAR